MNGNVMESVRGYGAAVRKAGKIKELFCKSGEVTVEDAKGRFITRIGGNNVLES